MPKILLIVLIILLTSACNGVDVKQKGSGLVDSMDEYIAALRWGRFDSAKEYHVNQDHSIPEIDTSNLEQIRVTGHKVKKKTVNDALDEAQAEIEMQYYHNQYGTVKKITLHQNWWYSEEAKKWFLSSDFPKF